MQEKAITKNVVVEESIKEVEDDEEEAQGKYVYATPWAGAIAEDEANSHSLHSL